MTPNEAVLLRVQTGERLRRRFAQMAPGDRPANETPFISQGAYLMQVMMVHGFVCRAPLYLWRPDLALACLSAAESLPTPVTINAGLLPSSSGFYVFEQPLEVEWCSEQLRGCGPGQLSWGHGLDGCSSQTQRASSQSGQAIDPHPQNSIRTDDAQRCSKDVDKSNGSDVVRNDHTSITYVEPPLTRPRAIRSNPTPIWPSATPPDGPNTAISNGYDSGIFHRIVTTMTPSRGAVTRKYRQWYWYGAPHTGSSLVTVKVSLCPNSIGVSTRRGGAGAGGRGSGEGVGRMADGVVGNGLRASPQAHTANVESATEKAMLRISPPVHDPEVRAILEEVARTSQR